jgi:prolipoprotein diacylglyceryltransferase
MNPVVFELGPVELRAYTAWLSAGILLALVVIVWRAYRYAPAAITRWLDVGIAALVGGIVGARLLHVALEWRYFSDHTDEIAKLSSGGLVWHGALLAGIPAVLLAAWLRRVPLKVWTDAAALALPVLWIAGWLACRRAGSAYGYEVWTLANWPGWLAEELPDIYGIIAPRLEVQLAGALFSTVLFGLALLLTWRDWLPGFRLWIVLALAGLGFALIGFFRADPSRIFYQRRADQVFDLLVFLLSTLTGSLIWLSSRRKMEADADEGYIGVSPDHAETR